MPLGLNLVFNGDSRNLVAACAAGKKAGQDMASVLQREIAGKMKMVFSAAAIEQATQRTGQWAQQLTQTAQQMGILNETLQALNLLAAKSNTPQEALISMFNNIDKARQEALNGNIDYITSLQRMGVTLQDIRTMNKTEFFGKALGGIGENISQATNQQRLDVQRVTGTPELELEKIMQTMGGAGFAAFAGSQKESGGIVDEEIVNQLSKTWGELMVDLTELGNELKPAATYLIALVRIVIKAITAIVDIFRGLWNAVEGLLTADIDKLEMGGKLIDGVILGLISGLFKIFTSLFDMIAKGIQTMAINILKKIPGMGKIVESMEEAKKVMGITQYVNKATKGIQEYLGLGEKQVERGEAATDVAAILASGGTTGLAKLGQIGTSKAAQLASKLGMETTAEGLIARSSRFGDVAAGRRTFGSKMTNVEEQTAAKESINGMVKGMDKESVGKFKAFIGESVAARQARILRYGMIGGGIAGAGAVTSGIASGTRTQASGTPPEPIIPNVGTFAGVGGADTSMVKMGGVFGSNFQSKMIALNQEMVKLLSQIQANTFGRVAAEKYTTPVKPTGNSAGPG